MKKKTLVECDQKPLETIFKKKLCDVQKRLQRMKMQLQYYDLDIVYKRMTDMHSADALSRNYTNNQEDINGFDMDIADV